MGKSMLYERLQSLGPGLERLRRYEERTSGTPLPYSSLFATPSSFVRSYSNDKMSNSPRISTRKREREDTRSVNATTSSRFDSPQRVSSSSQSSSSRRRTASTTMSSSSSSSSSNNNGNSSGSNAQGLKKVKSFDCYHTATSSSSSSSNGGHDEDGGTDNGARKRRRPAPVNKVDPIMFVPLKKKGIFKFFRPNGGVVAFNSDSLADFMISTGDFHDPETRIPFSDDNLREIDEICAKSSRRSKGAVKSRPSVLEAKRNPQAYAEARLHRDALEGLERCAGDVIADMLNVIETSDPDDAQIRLVGHELPIFADLYRQLRDADPLYAHQCLEHWRSFIAGPPNNPNQDIYGLVDCVKHYLQMLADTSPPIRASADTNTDANLIGAGAVPVLERERN